MSNQGIVIVYGTFCTWWDGVAEAKINEKGELACPHCGSPLLEKGNEDAFLSGCVGIENKFPGYTKMVKWSRGRCFQDFGELMKAWLSYEE